MRVRIYLALGLVSMMVVIVAAAQTLALDKSVWTMEVIQPKAGKFGPTLGYLDENWMRVREEAKRQGAIVDYHRFAEDATLGNHGTIVLLTEFKNEEARQDGEKLFASILKKLQANPSGVVMPYHQEELYDTLSTRVFSDYSDTYGPRFRLLAKNAQ